MDSIIFINILLIVGLLTGLVLTLVSLPGNFFIFAIALAYGFYDSFVHLSYGTIAAILGFLIVGEVVEFLAGALGARKEKASTRATLSALAGAIVGGMVGTAILPLIGSVIGAMLGAFAASYAAEYSKTYDSDKAKRVGVSVMKGQALGMIVKLVIAIGMIIVIALKMAWSF